MPESSYYTDMEPAMLPLGPAIEINGPLAQARRPIGLDDPGAIRRIDVAEVVRRISRDGVAAEAANAFRHIIGV